MEDIDLDDQSTRDLRKKLLDLRNEEKEYKKDEKKYRKKERKRLAKDIEAICQGVGSTLERLHKIQDMHLRCYMLLDKFVTMIDGGMVGMRLANLPSGSRDVVSYQLDNLKEEITFMMNWVINEKTISPAETENPIPESSPLGHND